MIADQEISESIPASKVRSPGGRRSGERISPIAGLNIALLTGGGDKPYALGLAEALASNGVSIDFIGSDELDDPELRKNPDVRFLNLRGDQRPDVSRIAKVLRVLSYYVKLLRYATTAKPKIFHLLWNNKCEIFDRTVLMWYYRLLGKRLMFTAHNVNAGKRDGSDSWLNRLTLGAQYRLLDHIFVHTDKMKRELMSEFGVPEHKVSVIPFGINNTVPDTDLTAIEAKRELGLDPSDKSLLFFGNIAPYKGVEYLVAAFITLLKNDPSYRLIIAGRTKGCEEYWDQIQRKIAGSGKGDRVVARIDYVPDEQTEIYFKAADVLVLPYAHVFQSGVLFLGYSFGLPVLAADVGSLKDEIVEGETGFVFAPKDSADLAKTIRKYFESNLYRKLGERRAQIRTYANERYSWDKVASITTKVYSSLLGNCRWSATGEVGCAGGASPPSLMETVRVQNERN